VRLPVPEVSVSRLAGSMVGFSECFPPPSLLSVEYTNSDCGSGYTWPLCHLHHHPVMGSRNPTIWVLAPQVDSFTTASWAETRSIRQTSVYLTFIEFKPKI
jgi:hypothetical protein